MSGEMQAAASALAARGVRVTLVAAPCEIDCLPAGTPLARSWSSEAVIASTDAARIAAWFTQGRAGDDWRHPLNDRAVGAVLDSSIVALEVAPGADVSALGELPDTVSFAGPAGTVWRLYRAALQGGRDRMPGVHVWGPQAGVPCVLRVPPGLDRTWLTSPADSAVACLPPQAVVELRSEPVVAPRSFFGSVLASAVYTWVPA